MNKRRGFLALALLGAHALCAFDHVDVIEWSTPSSVVGMMTHSYHFTTRHQSQSRGHYVFLEAQFFLGNQWGMLERLPRVTGEETPFLWARDREEKDWEFRFLLRGNHTWPIRIVAWTHPGGDGAWTSQVVHQISGVYASGAPDLAVSDLGWDHGVAWKDNRYHYWVENLGNGIAKSYHMLLKQNGSDLIGTPVIADLDYWFFPNTRLADRVSTKAETTSPPPGTHQFEVIYTAEGDTHFANNSAFNVRTFVNQARFQVSGMHGLEVPAFSSPTLLFQVGNRGTAHGEDWWYLWFFSWAEQQWTDGGWMYVDFSAPGQSRSLVRSFPEGRLAQEWHHVWIWSHYAEGPAVFDDPNHSWFYVNPTDAPRLVMTDLNSQADGIRTNRSGDSLRMVRETYPREAAIEMDFFPLAFSPNFPKWALTSGSPNVSFQDGDPFAHYLGSSDSAMQITWTGGRTVSSFVEIEDKDIFNIGFSTDGIQGFIDAVNFSISTLGGGEDRFRLTGSVNGSSENVDFYNDGTRTGRKWLFNGSFGFELAALKKLKSPAVPVPGLPLVKVWTELEIGKITAEAAFPGLGYDPSRWNPFTSPASLTGAASFRATAATGIGSDLCNTQVTIKGGGGTSIVLEGLLDPRPDGIYLDGWIHFGKVVLDVEVEVTFMGVCQVEGGTGVEVYEGGRIAMSDTGGIRIYEFEQ
jgi:hypothetical protein